MNTIKTIFWDTLIYGTRLTCKMSNYLRYYAITGNALLYTAEKLNLSVLAYYKSIMLILLEPLLRYLKALYLKLLLGIQLLVM